MSSKSGTHPAKEVGREDYALCRNQRKNNTVYNCDSQTNDALEMYNENPNLPAFKQPKVKEMLDSANDGNYGVWTLKHKTDGKILGNVFKDKETLDREAALRSQRETMRRRRRRRYRSPFGRKPRKKNWRKRPLRKSRNCRRSLK